MCHATKQCPRCKKAFACKPGNITQCQCFGLAMSEELKKHLEERYSDCLCRECLEYLQSGTNLFREHYLKE